MVPYALPADCSSAAVATGKRYVKDLRRITNDLSRVVLLDNNASSWLLTQDNGLHIQASRSYTPFLQKER